MIVIHLDYGNSKKIMKELYTNVNIIGGGLIGAAIAHCLSKLGFEITILEKNDFYSNLKKNSDYRTVAVSEGTKNFLDKIGIWKEAKKFSEPIKKIKIIDRDFSNYLDFDNNRRSSNLGYIISNKKLLEIFYNQLLKEDRIKIFNNTEITGLDYFGDTIQTHFKKKIIKSNLNIAADGKNSFVRNLLKTPSYKKIYKKKALVFNIIHSHNHDSTAYEFFFNRGPLAILPMKSKNNKNMSSIVWTENPDYAENLISLKNKDIISILNKKTKNSIGEIIDIKNKQIFPISAHINSKFFEKRTIYVGDSAHSIHPIAGQGWNLGMRDVHKLYKISKRYKDMGSDLGDKAFCNEYNKNTFYDAYVLYQITDKLDKIFKNDNTLFSILRSTGLNFIQRNNKTKNFISDFAMGF